MQCERVEVEVGTTLTVKMAGKMEEELLLSKEDEIRGPDPRNGVHKHLPHAVRELRGPFLIKFAPYWNFLLATHVANSSTLAMLPLTRIRIWFRITRAAVIPAKNTNGSRTMDQSR